VSVAQSPRPAATGERVFTSYGGWKPTWERHVAAYKLCEPFLPPGLVCDLGCGVGHSFELLSPRPTVGVDIDAAALAGQARRTIQADMRAVPLPDACFASVVSVHSLEHVPDPERVMAEVARLVEPGGTAVFVTPNRLTFGRPDEVIDPYHFHEFDASQLHSLCATVFAEADLHGIFGSRRYLELVDEQRQKLASLLRLDPLRVRRLVPRRARQWLYDNRLAKERRVPDPRATVIEVGDFWLGDDCLEEALDLVAVARRP
jgi:SAM-dependent methyltransferase